MGKNRRPGTEEYAEWYFKRHGWATYSKAGICPVCGAMFTIRANKVYCSQRCKNIHAGRTGRTREENLKIARMVQEEREKKTGITRRGRKSKKDIVRSWQIEHPDGKKIDCQRDTGLSKKTVYKWWGCVEMEGLNPAKMIAAI